MINPNLVIVDVRRVVVTFSAELDPVELEQYGRIINYLPQIGTLFLMLPTPDTNGEQIRLVAAVRGVKTATYNQRAPREELVQSYTIPDLAQQSAAIYTEMNVQAAWDITTGDERIKVGVNDTGADPRHPDMQFVSGGVFSAGIKFTNGGFPVKVSILDMTYKPGDPILWKIVKHNSTRQNPMVTTPEIPAFAYADSTCNTALFSGDVPSELSNILEFWVDEPVDLLIDYYIDADNDAAVWVEGVGRAEMYDGYGHGSGTGGIVCGQHNGRGVPGIAPDCTTVIYRAQTDDGYFSEMDNITSLVAAADDGCHVLSCSWGGRGSSVMEGPAVFAAYQYVLDSGCIFVAAAGNTGSHPTQNVATDMGMYPAIYSGVISVGACGNPASYTELNGRIGYESQNIDYSRISFFSVKTPEVFIIAPGWGWRVAAPLDRAYMYQSRLDPDLDCTGWSYQGRGTGTSWAAPAVAAGMGLMLSKALIGYSSQDPAEVKAFLAANCNRARVKSILTSTAKTPVKLANGNAATVGFGGGRINIGAAVAAV